MTFDDDFHAPTLVLDFTHAGDAPFSRYAKPPLPPVSMPHRLDPYTGNPVEEDRLDFPDLEKG